MLKDFSVVLFAAGLSLLGCGDDGDGAKNTGGGGGDAGNGSGGSSSGTGANTGSGGKQVQPPVKVGDCADLPEPGVFEEITPPEVRAKMGMEIEGGNGNKYGGPFAMAVDPVNLGTVYSGTLYNGFWKTTDCGATWTNVPSGENAEKVNSGMNWTLVVDPVEPETVYTNSGYGSNGLFKSTDGGVNWTDIWSKTSQPELGMNFEYNFVNVIAMDPDDHKHILLTFHESCRPPHPTTCMAESTDGGESWTMLDGEPEWNGNEGQVIFFLDGPKTWLWGSQTNGFWRTPDGGATWEQIKGMNTSHMQGSQLLRTKAGEFFVAGSDGIWRSPDGKADTWKMIPDTGPIVGGLISDGTNMYASTCYFGGFCTQARYLRSPETDGNTWEALEVPKIAMGGNLGYDPEHKLLYSSNLGDGMWRVVLE